MSNQLHSVDQTLTNAFLPAPAIQKLRTAFEDFEQPVEQGIENIMICYDLLCQAKAAVPDDKWKDWVVANLSGLKGLGYYFKLLAITRVSSLLQSDEVKRVIPPPGKSLRFSRDDGDGGGTALCIEPAYREGYYYVTLVGWQHDHEHCSSFAEGPREPVLSNEIWATCQQLEFDDLVEDGDRTESTSTPLAFNRWLHEGHVQQRQPDADQQPKSEQGAARECSPDDLSDGGGN